MAKHNRSIAGTKENSFKGWENNPLIHLILPTKFGLTNTLNEATGKIMAHSRKTKRKPLTIVK
jgi:hypothetical protein